MFAPDRRLVGVRRFASAPSSLRGVNVPFRSVELTVGEIMEEQALYLCADGAARPLPLLRQGMESAQDTCYVFSKIVDGKARMVSYHRGSTSSIEEELPEVLEVVAMLAGMANAEHGS